MADIFITSVFDKNMRKGKSNSISQITEPTHLFMAADTQAIVPFSQIEMNKNNSYSRYHQHRTEHILFDELRPKLPHPKRTINKEGGWHNKNSRNHHLATSPCSDFITIKNWKP